MNRPRNRVGFVFAAIFASALITRAAAQAPESLLPAAGADPLTFVSLLAEAGIPAGLEVRQADRQRFSLARQWNPERLNHDHLRTESTIPLAQVVAAFNRLHGGYQAAITDAVVVIRPEEGRARYLDSRPAFDWLSEQGLMRFAEKVFVPIDPKLDQPGGRGGSALGVIGVKIDTGDGLQLSIDARGRTVIEVLNEIARQAPGHPWLVTTIGDYNTQIAAFGFVHRYGTATELPISR